ncbi:hypothetical protein SAMN05443634_103263 [Chishuiella changwenlii]|uniref:Uncharacterized protein n=1 Tax=Chishuiella changwenlii TaxID=1434701 RepID=A0A1M6VBL1_9FLAO|nr:hypothetical protein [Chishuiella changwenlii]GGF09773.1 hypothetical protein GCM10010984_28660 [Chishuiella changwenlii]SHK78893.1 hypothetical protein SAMN05443634_103263 [Chishuiella changwenlii]
MNEKDPINSLNEIKSMMQKSSKFTSINGWSGIWAGFVGIISAAIAHFILLGNSSNYSNYQEFSDVSTVRLELILLGIVTVIIAATGGFYFMIKKSSKDNIKFINPVTKRILKRFCFILFIGGIVCLLFIKNLNLLYFAPSTLLFYGLALFHVERDTITEIKYLAITEIFLGLLAYYFIYNGLLFWLIGFGVLHVVFGIWIILKYRNKA